MPPVRMCIESETVGEIPGEKSPPFDYTVVESVFLLEDRLFIMVGGLCQQRRNAIPSPRGKFRIKSCADPFFACGVNISQNLRYCRNGSYLVYYI